MVPLDYYLVLSAIIFAIGVVGVLIRRNLIVVLMSIELMLNAVNLNADPNPSGSRQLTARAKGRRIGTTANFYPVFCSEAPTVTATNESFSINVEFVNGTSANNMISSSSFNYTISPRR